LKILFVTIFLVFQPEMTELKNKIDKKIQKKRATCVVARLIFCLRNYVL